MTKASDNVFPRFLVSEGGSTATPAAGRVTMYAKADGLLYSKDDAGTETLVSGGTAGGSNSLIVQDEGSTIGTATVLNFVGGGTASFSGGTATFRPGGLLAVNAYGTGTSATYSTSSTTLADVDATNMAVTFTAPASGNVIVRLTAFHDQTGITGFNAWWGLRESTTDLANQVVSRGTADDGHPVSIPFYLTGVSGGAHTYKWSHAVGTASGTARIVYGAGTATAGSFGKAVMEVWEAP